MKKYSNDFKEKAILQAKKDGVRVTACMLNIPLSTLYYWISKEEKLKSKLNNAIEKIRSASKKVAKNKK